MANTIQVTTGKMVKKAIAILHDKLLLPAWIDRQYQSEFAKEGAKVGQTVYVRVPAQVKTQLRDGVGGSISAQNFVEDKVALTVKYPRSAPFNFTTQELTLDMDMFGERVLQPAAEQLASDMESDILAEVTPYVANAVLATGNTNTTCAWVDILNAGAKMTQFLAPTANRYIMIDPVDEVAIVNEVKDLFQDSSEIAQAYLDGYIGRTAGFLWARSNRLPTITIGADVAGALAADAVEGSNQISVSGFAANQVIAAGTVISIAARNAVGPETKASLGYAKQFSVVSAVTLSGTGTGTLTLNEKIYFGATAQKNIASAPVSTDVVNILGAANTTYRQVLAFQKNAFTMFTVDYAQPRGGVNAARDAADGISMLVIDDYTGNTLSQWTSLEVLYGAGCLRPGFAAKVLVPVA